MIDYGKMAGAYDEQYTSDLCKRENEAIARLLNEYAAKGKKIFDVGCGTGLTLDLCSHIDRMDYIGIDASREMVGIAKEKHPDYFFRYQKAERVTGHHRFDTILCLFSIPYITERAVLPLYAALNDGGVVVCVCYNKPYKNPASVYAGHKWKYRFTVGWKVRSVMREFERHMPIIRVEDLVPGNDAYKVVVFKKI